MDKDSENVEENEKYSFLLGSAIRNEDPDQFLSIYDAILPKTLTDKQIDYIKDKARGIADLPDEEFNQLVLNARDYSLAKGREKMSLGSGGSSRLRHNDDDDKSLSNSSDEDEITPQRNTIIPPNLPYFTDSDHCIVDIEQVEKRTDNDSGIYNSSKATTSVGSYSDHDDSEGDDRGCFDYFPSQVRIGQPCVRYNLKYDEVHEVESDKNSQNDIESPRSENSLGKDSDTDVYRGTHIDGTEMQTFSLRNSNNESDDFQTDDESDDDDVRINPHQRLYRTRSSNYYTPMQLESTEDYNGGSYGTSTFSFDSSKKALQDRSASSLRGVDDGISFPFYSRYQKYNKPNYGSTSSDSVHVEKSVFPRDCPPFGHGTDQLNKVGSSIESLISSKNNHSVSNMPEGRHISSLDLASEDGKKKKKKKKNSKDDLDDKGKKKDFSDLDENGNPNLRSLTSGAYRQMREPPRSQSGAIVSSSKNRSPTSRYESPFPSDFHQFSHYSVAGQQVKDLEDITPQSNQDRKRKKIKKEKVVLSQEIDNYVGDKKQIDELVDFIENDGTKKSKKLNPNTTDNNSISNAKTTDNKNKKNKEKKQVSINTTSRVIDNKYNIGEIIKDKETEEENIVPTKVGAPKISSVGEKEQEEVVENSVVDSMGNSQGRNSENEEKASFSEDLKVENNSKLSINNKILTTAIADLADSENKQNMQVNKNCSTDDIPSTEIQKNNGEKNGSSECKPAIESSANGGNNNNKKTKGKTNNNNKLETKVVGSTNNIKQNNVKNNKSKDSNAAKVLNTANCVSPVSVNEEGEHFVPNSYYIFTDIDPIHELEVEFTEVRKKKKRPMPSGPPPPVRDFTKEHVNHKPSIVKEEPRVQPPIRSVTPPPYHHFSAIETAPVDQRARDLSPSAFPALDRGNQKKASFRDGRRNSTGDVPTEVLLKVQDDSDLESVKSLPAQGGCANQSTSPRLPVSYAKMAASPRPSGTSLASVKTEDSDESSINNSTNVMATVWKGAPTERRHSIGSSPENSKENSQTPVTVRQKCGSQENIKIAGEDMPVPSENLQNETFSITKSKSVTECIPTYSTLNCKEHPSAALTNTSSCINKVSSKDNFSNESVDDIKINHSVKTKTKTSNGPKNNVSVAVKQTNDSKKFKSKSVIFLDKRLNDVPQNLGITFGFDNPECITIRNDKNVVTDSSPQNTSSSDDVSNNIGSCSSSSSSSSPAVIDKCVNNSTTSSSSSSSIDNSEQNSELLKDSKNNKHILAGKNGIVSYSHLSYNNHPMKSDSSTITFEGSDSSAKISSDLDANKGDNKSDHILVCYGELPPISSNDSENKPSKHLKFLQETGHNHFGIFNYTDAVNFLNKEWNNVLAQQKRNPENVKVYSETQAW